MATVLIRPAGPLECSVLHVRRTDSMTQGGLERLSALRSRLTRKDKSSSAMHKDGIQGGSNSHPQAQTMQPTRRPEPGTRNPFSNRSSEAPPPTYTDAIKSAPVPVPAVQTPSADTADDRYAFLSTFDTIFLIDDSGSMAGSRWREAAAAIEAITPICTAHDADGLDIYFLNNPDTPYHHNVTSATTVREIFETVRPRGGTPTGQRLDKILSPYLRRYAADPETIKPINVICITDGEPSDDVESPLIKTAKKLDKLDAPAWQIGVQFFQVGRDEEAKRHLRQLDDELAEIAGDDDLRDIVDTVPFTGAEGTQLTGEGILKVVLGAVNRRLDRKRSKDLHR